MTESPGLHDMSSALRRAVKRSISEPEADNDDAEGEGGANEEEPAPDNQSILRLLEENEKVVLDLITILIVTIA